MKEHYYVDIGYATFLVITDSGKVINTAPIVKWMVGKSWAECQVWIRKKNGSIEKLGLQG